jgi:predicted nucleic acid-binding protein
MLARGDQLYTSTLTVGEILIKPVVSHHPELAERYLAFFRRPSITVLPFDFKAAPLYARVREDRTIRPPDAVQLACAAAAEIDLFITNDARLSQKVVSGVNFISSLERALI